MILTDSPDTSSKLFDHFTFKESNWKFLARKYPGHTGDVRFIKFAKKGELTNLKTSVGFYYHLIKYLNDNNLPYESDVLESIYRKITDFHFFYNKLIEKMGFQFRDMQYNAALSALENDFCILHLDTNSGKTFILFSIVTYMIWKKECKQILIVCTDLGLTKQMFEDFGEYMSGFLNYKVLICHGKATVKSFEGYKVIISNFQYLGNRDKSLFKNISHVFFDECDLCTAKTYDKIVKKLPPSDKRIGVTGTLPSPKSVKFNKIRKKTGDVMARIKKEDLMELGYSAKPIIKVIELDYLSINDRLEIYDCKINIEDEDQMFRVKMLESSKLRDSQLRLDYISNLAVNSIGNGVIFCSDKKYGYGLKIKEYLLSLNSGKEIYYADGDTKSSDRQTYTNRMRTGNNRILIVTYSIWGRGISVPNLSWIIAAEPKKNETTLDQAMGRGERIKDGKNHYIWYDIVDNFDINKQNYPSLYDDGITYKSYMMKNFSNRKSFYKSKNWDIDIHEKVTL